MAKDPMEVLIVGNGSPLPNNVCAMLDSARVKGIAVDRIADVIGPLISRSLAAVIVVNLVPDDKQRAAIAAEANRLHERLGGMHVGVLLLSADADCLDHIGSMSACLDVVTPDVSGDELLGRCEAMAHYRPMIQHLERELGNMQRLGKRLNLHFTEIDQEMRLASRLQHDFLPKETPTVGGIHISTLYRPASWVSGDIYDVFRIDEEHIGLYVADAVGHGMAAGLLTMFIKRAIVPKRIHKNNYEVIPPGDVLAHLNESLKGQNLPNCQFVTASYCLYNVRTRRLQVARGGHPYPIRVDTDGGMTEVRSIGGLLGVFAGEDFETVCTELSPGEKLILYSDGVEMAFLEQKDAPQGEQRYKKEFQAVANLPADELVSQLRVMLDSEEGSLNPHDDVTVIVLDVPN
jgi:sigma-B regulation protein RsbU (phosphoserine phosphatase)